MKHIQNSWWETDEYKDDSYIPTEFETLAGPHGVALVRTWPDERTDPGWGLQGPDGTLNTGFMGRYPRKEFLARRALYGFARDKWNFAIVMRSLSVVCIDIDGKNGGREHIKRLNPLPPTLAETSKSGDGFHLFYRVDEPWTSDKGFGSLNDRIGIEQGVDVRATGCVYHYKSQRWNDRKLARLPAHLKDLLSHRELKQAREVARIDSVLASGDTMEVLMLQDEIVTELEKVIPVGKRNITLFAIGNKMRQSKVPDWETLLEDRALRAGLDPDEVTKLVRNVKTYGS